MKRIFTFLLTLAVAVAAWAERPLLVGHRGSLYGVENSVESFTKGAEMGYEFLETDFKVTKDKQFVCSHDDDISRLSSDGSSLAIASNTLADLQKHPFRQTRSGVTYEGRLCSGQEYLDVCKKYNVRPLIELKWATGINNNDCSNIPLLIDFIEKNGFRDKCIILTSMKPCLEYIRKNYPDIELQFLTGQYWASHFDWCVQYGIDVDIQAGYFDKATVTKYHDKGLKVNMWTTNSNDGYKQYGNWGCDFITTDYLDPKKLPELDASVTNPVNTVDYPNYDGVVRGNYPTDKLLEADSPAALAGRTVKKALFRDGEWIVLSFGGNGSDPKIERIDPETGNVTGSYSTSGIDVVGDIAMTADGILIASNTATVAHMGVSGAVEKGIFRLYKWTSPTSAPVQFYSTNSAADLGNWTNDVSGEHIAASGRMNDLKVYVSSHSNVGTVTRVVGLLFEKEAMTKHAYALQGEWGADFTMTVSPTSRDCFVVDSPALEPLEYSYNWIEGKTTLDVNSDFPASAMSKQADGISFLRRGTKVYGVFPTTSADGSAFTAAVYDVTDGMKTAAPVTAKLHEGMGSAANTFAATAIENIEDGNMLVHFLALPGGMATFRLEAVEPNDDPDVVDLELTCDWIYSESTSNHPGNIDGTNAQQGTAVDGYFYINNKSEKKLHVFDRNGYVGNIPGGSGYGCARDDAGNIIIRDDVLTGNTHTFMVYAAGTIPGDYTPAITFDATVVASGQTNFINASGDVLNGTGHIYLYPSGQTTVNILTVTQGEVVASKSYTDLSMTGTAAGYVVPVEDDTERWLYQIRGTGIYMYNGGQNVAVSTARADTKAPARNSTGGMAYFKISGNTILVHNSGANYLGGFTVKNLSDNEKVIANVDPIGSKGYVSGGNYSTFNWIIPEKVSDAVYNLYQYCPANGIAKYTLTDKLNAVRDIALTTPEDDSFGLYVDHNALTVSGVEVNTLRIYNVAGVLVANADSDTANIANLTPGVYIVTVNDTLTRKFVKH